MLLASKLFCADIDFVIRGKLAVLNLGRMVSLMRILCKILESQKIYGAETKTGKHSDRSTIEALRRGRLYSIC